MTAQAESTKPAVDESQLFPPGVPYIVGNEGAERFSYYGMRAILKTYLAALYVKMAVVPGMAAAATLEAEKAASAKATAVTHLFMAGTYAFPMIGALLADRLLGKYPVIFWVSMLYCAGHGTLAIAGRFEATGDYGLAEYGFYVGLALIAMGAGGIKPCVSANVGDQFTEKNRGLVTMVFQIFYFIINFGSFFSTILVPVLKDKYGAEVAFGVPGVLMGLATFVFWLGRHKFVHVPPKPGGSLGLLDVVSSSLLFAPVVAIIAAVFIVADGYTTPSNEGLSAGQFYWAYLTTYLAYLAAHSWALFAIAAGLVVIGLFLFSVRQKRQQDTGVLAMLFYAVTHRGERKPGEGFFDTVKAKFGEEAAEGPPAVLRIVGVFSMVSVFWALFDQHASTWITQAQDMNLDLRVPLAIRYFLIYGTIALSIYGGVWLFSWVSNRKIQKKTTWLVVGTILAAGLGCGVYDVINGEWVDEKLKPEQISALNPLMVMLIIPALNVFVYNPFKKRGREIKPLVRMAVGMFLAAAAFAYAGVLQTRIEAAGPGQVHVLWQTVQYLIMTTAEVLVSITSLEFAYTQAPRSMKSTIMGCYLLSVTAGNVLVAFLAPMETILKLSEFFNVFAALMAAAAVVFVVIASRYKGKTYLQDAAPAH